MNYAQQLSCGIEQLNVKFDSTQIDCLLQFVELLQKWNKTYNLTAIENTEDILNKHILDSIAVEPYISGQRIVDVGSGAGLPGIPLAVLCKDKEFVLLDANAKKTHFIQQAVIELGLKNVRVVQKRVEQYAPKHEFDTVVSRAYATGSKFFQTTLHLSSRGQFLLMLGKKTALDNMPDQLKLMNIVTLQIPDIAASRQIAVLTANG